MRGKEDYDIDDNGEWGITPAYAGKSAREAGLKIGV